MADQGSNSNIDKKENRDREPTQASSEEKRKLKKLSAQDLQRWHMLQRKEKKGVGMMIKKESEPDCENNASSCSENITTVEQAGESSMNTDSVMLEDAREGRVDLVKKVKIDDISAVENSPKTSVRKGKVTKNAKSTKTDPKIDKTVANNSTKLRKRNKKGSHVESSDDDSNIKKEPSSTLQETGVKNKQIKQKEDILDEASVTDDVSTPTEKKMKTNKNVKNHNTDDKNKSSVTSSNRNRRNYAKRVSYVESSDSDSSVSVEKKPSSKLPLKKCRVPKGSSKSKVVPKTKIVEKRKRKSRYNLLSFVVINFGKVGSCWNVELNNACLIISREQCFNIVVQYV